MTIGNERKRNEKTKLESFIEELRAFPRHPFAFLWRSQTLEGLIARRELLGFKLKRDVPLIEKLRRGILASQFPRGSFKGSVGWTAYELWRLSHLDVEPSHPQVVKAIEFVEAHQTCDGNFYERHSVPTVYPALDGGEFSFGSFSLGFTSYVLLGLKRWREGSEQCKRAIKWLIDKYLSDGLCCLPCAVYMLMALSNEGTMEATLVSQEILLWLEAQQQSGGIWNYDVSFTFIVLYGLGSTEDECARKQVRHAIPLLLKLQFEDGGWGKMGRAEKSLAVAMALHTHNLIEEFLLCSKAYYQKPRPLPLLSDLSTSLDRFTATV